MAVALAASARAIVARCAARSRLCASHAAKTRVLRTEALLANTDASTSRRA
jgi:hypothetical protein